MLATHNRREALMHTLRGLHGLERPRDSFEIVVVDNASTDGSAEAATAWADRVVRRVRNEGSCAKAWGVDVARGRFVVFLDDDSAPRGGCVTRMLEHFAAEPRLAAAGFTIHLPDGRRECSALPGVSVGCGVGYRAEALRSVGGLDRTFFMQAEEYDLAFKLVTAGWQVRVFDDLHADHQKTATARRSARTAYYDIRNNLRVVARHLPSVAAGIYRRDWMQRYAWLAEGEGHWAAHRAGRRSGLRRGVLDRWLHTGRRLSPAGFEFFFRWEEWTRRFEALRADGVRRLVGLDLGKNVYAYVQAAERTGLSVAVIGDDRFAAPQRRYRGIPVVSFEEAMGTSCDAFVVFNMAAAQAEATARRARAVTDTAVVSGRGAGAAVCSSSEGREESKGRVLLTPGGYVDGSCVADCPITTTQGVTDRRGGGLSGRCSDLLTE